MREHELSGAELSVAGTPRAPGEQDEERSEAGSQQREASSEYEHPLRRYDDEEVVTKPWPPYH